MSHKCKSVLNHQPWYVHTLVPRVHSECESGKGLGIELLDWADWAALTYFSKSRAVPALPDAAEHGSNNLKLQREPLDMHRSISRTLVLWDQDLR